MNTPKSLSGWSLIFLHLLPGFLLLVGFLILTRKADFEGRGCLS